MSGSYRNHDPEKERRCFVVLVGCFLRVEHRKVRVVKSEEAAYGSVVIFNAIKYKDMTD